LFTYGRQLLDFLQGVGVNKILRVLPRCIIMHFINYKCKCL